MRLDGAIDIAAPAVMVWPLVLDPSSLATCVPGVHAVHQIDDRTFEGTVSATVGPIDGTFRFRAVMTRHGPEALTVDVEGTDSLTASRVVANIVTSIVEAKPGATTLTYRATVTTKGRLAIIGDMVMRATAGVMIGQVTRCLRARLESAEPAPS